MTDKSFADVPAVAVTEVADSRRVVISAAFGGFGLSAEGQIAYLARKGKRAFFYADDRDSAERLGERDYVRISPEEADARLMVTTVTADIGERVPHDVIWPGRHAHPDYFSDRDVPRDDPDLVAVVEELNGQASGRFAALRVVTIPADVKWHIEKYDGNEHVAEDHRVWYGDDD